MHPQAAFARALLDPLAPCPPGLRRAGDADPAQRYAIYRNNVVASLIQALADTFPVCRELVGADFFHAMAHAYVARRLPRSPVLARYGGAFAAFVAAHAPAASVPYLADMARLEYLRVRAYYAADAVALDAAAAGARIAALSKPASARLRLHPAARALVSPYAIHALWAAHQGALDIAEVDPYAAQGALVLRDPAEAVLAIPLAASAAAFVRALRAGLPLGAAHSQAADPGLALNHLLALLIRHGAIISIEE